MSLFYKIFLSCIAVFLVILVAGLVVLSTALSDFEGNLPNVVAEKFFVDQVKSGKLYGVNGNRFESRINIINTFNETFKSKDLEFHSISSSESDVYKYIIDANGQKVLSFEVVPSGKQSRFGFKTYEVDKINLFFGKSITVVAPADCKVKVNGVELDESHRKNEQSNSLELPESVLAVPIYVYEINDIYTKPEIDVKDANGKPCEVVFNEETGNYEIGYNYDDELKEQYSYLARTVVKNYATYMQNDCAFGEIAKYLQKGTNTYNYIRTSEVGWVWAHEGFAFSDEWCDEFVAISDTVFTCRVKMTQTLYLTNNQPYKDYIDVTLCFNKQPNGVFLVYSLKGNR